MLRLRSSHELFWGAFSCENPKYPPLLWCAPFSIEHPQDNFSLQIEIGTLHQGISDLQSVVCMKNCTEISIPLSFGGRHVLECSIERRGSPKEGGYWACVSPFYRLLWEPLTGVDRKAKHARTGIGGHPKSLGDSHHRLCQGSFRPHA